MARSTRRPGNLPAQTTTFIGRRHELAEIKKRLGADRLITLVGAGGVGKTRLAIRSARDLARAFKDGSWLVELAEVTDPAIVPSAMLAALDLRDQAGTQPDRLLLDYLRDKEMLLVVDNCEHLLRAAAQTISSILRAAPGVHIVATSREPLSTSGEHVLPVAPLPLPSPNVEEPLDRLRQNDAVALFVERAEAASGGFELLPSNRGAVIEICRHLDGLPLAIELAAVRTRVLSVREIVDRLGDRFELLTAGGRAALPRHETLRTAIDWSYELLDPSERALSRRLAVFAGRFTLVDARSVCADRGEQSGATFDIISSLVEKSLVMTEERNSVTWYRMHETMREYGMVRLRETGELDFTLGRYVDYLLSASGQSASAARYHLLEWLDWADGEIDNLRAALKLCISARDSERGLRLATAMAWYWFTRATNEGARWLDQVLALRGGPPEARAWAHFMRGFVAILQGDATAATPALRRASASARRLNQNVLLSHALALSSIADNMRGKPAEAKRSLARAAEVTAGLGDPAATVGLLQARAFNAFFVKDLPAVKAAATPAIEISRESGDRYALGMMLMNLGLANMMAGDLDEAGPLFAEALRSARQIDDRVAQFYLLQCMGAIAVSRGQARLAVRLLGAAETIGTGVGASVMPFLQPALQRATEIMVAAVGSARFRTDFASGQSLDRDEALRLALGEAPADRSAVSNQRDSTPLGKRESAIAQLVAQGMTNKEIGSRLFISDATVATHIRNILNKLGFKSRSQIASWVSADRS